MISIRGKRALVALLFAFTLIIGVSTQPASAGTEFKDLPVTNTWTNDFVYWHPGYTIDNPQHFIVQLNLWITINLWPTSMRARIGNFNGYAYAQLQCIDCTNGTYGGVQVTYLGNGSNYPSYNPGWYPDGSKKTCVATTGSTNVFGCAQQPDGSLWNQPVVNWPPNVGTSVIGGHFVVCVKTGGNKQDCRAWYFTAF